MDGTSTSASDEILTPLDVERVYKIGVAAQGPLRKRGLLPYIKIGRHVRYRRRELEACLDANARPAAAGAR